MYRIFSEYLEIMQEDRAEAIKTASHNAAAVVDMETGAIIADYRTQETEADERG